MSATPVPVPTKPKNLWINAFTFALAEHGPTLDEAVCSLSGYDVIYQSPSAMAVDGLTKTDLVLAHLALPYLGFGRDEPGCSIVYNDRHFDEVETTIGSIGEHVTCTRLAEAHFSLRSIAGFRKLKDVDAGVKLPRTAV